MWKRVSGIACKTWLIDKSPNYLDSLEDLHMHTWLATGLMGRVIRSRRTLALVAVLAVLAFALPVAFAQQGHAATPASQVAAAVHSQAGAATQQAAPAMPESEAGGEANLKVFNLDDLKIIFIGGMTGHKLLAISL